MGLAVLPARLLGEMDLLADTVLAGKNVREVPELTAHADWAEELLEKYPAFRPENLTAETTKEDFEQILRDEIGLVFANVLEHCGVFKETEAGLSGFLKFADSVT